MEKIASSVFASLSRVSSKELTSYSWWEKAISSAISEDPVHFAVEITLIIIIFYLFTKQSYDPRTLQKLSKKDEEELIRSWEPIPLAPATNRIPKPSYVVESMTARTVEINGSSYVNFASMNFLGLASHPLVIKASRDTIDKYGVGSCGPRGFYGSFDVHLDLEKELADFLKAEECILYSDSIASISSVIPAFAKRGDLVVADKGVSFAIQQGLTLSRSQVKFFDHNDIKSLESILESVIKNDRKQSKKLNRRFIVVEGISSYFGDIAPLSDILRLARKYKFRLILDDTLAIGVLGREGRGSLEHFNIKLEDDILVCGSLDTSFATVGGFCVASHTVVDHQRLSGAGYCFSASSPPYASSAGLATLALLQSQQGRSNLINLQSNSQKLNKLLRNIRDIHVDSDEQGRSPVFHLRVNTGSRNRDEEVCDAVRDISFKSGIAVSVPDYIPAEMETPSPSVRVLVASHHTKEDIEKLAKVLERAFAEALNSKKN